MAFMCEKCHDKRDDDDDDVEGMKSDENISLKLNESFLNPGN
jgi:hypothetical protein